MGGPAPGAEVSSFSSKQWAWPDPCPPPPCSTQAAPTANGVLGPSELDAGEQGRQRPRGLQGLWSAQLGKLQSGPSCLGCPQGFLRRLASLQGAGGGRCRQPHSPPRPAGTVSSCRPLAKQNEFRLPTQMPGRVAGGKGEAKSALCPWLPTRSPCVGMPTWESLGPEAGQCASPASAIQVTAPGGGGGACCWGPVPQVPRTPSQYRQRPSHQQGRGSRCWSRRAAG